jgi:uncharacterized protein (TIRG00374 family)
MKKFLKRTGPFLLTLMLAGLLLRRGIQWSELQALLQKAQWGWLLLGLLWQACAYGAVTWLNELLLQRYDARVPFGKQYLIPLAMAFMEAAIPTASISGAVLRVRLLKPHKVPADVATVTTMAEMSLITISVIMLALPVAGIALWDGVLGAFGFNAWTIIPFGILTMTIATTVRWHSPRSVQIRGKLLQAVSRFWEDRVRARWPQALNHWTSQRLFERLRYLKTEFISLLHDRPLAIILSLLARSGFEALGLMMCFFAVGQFLPIQTILLIYTLTIAVNSLGAIPGGVGLVEISLTTVYAQFGISAEMALAIALAYRLTDYWLPRVFGGIAWLWLEGNFPRRTMETIS